MRHGLLGGRAWPLSLVLALGLAAAASSAQMAPICARLPATPPVRAVAVPAAVPLLQQRRDLRSIALADYLIAASGAPGGEAARVRLQDRARAATDPLLTVLALHMPCARTGCRNIEASQWSRLEPDNLLAWLALPTRGTADAAYLLQQVATQVREVRSHREEVDALLQDLPPSGLGLRQPWGLLNLAALGAACREPRDATTAELCEAIAEGLWTEGGATERHMAAVIGLQLLPRLPARRAVWEPRLREFDAVVRAGLPPGDGVAGTREICQALVLPREGERAALSEVDRARLVMRLSGLSLWDAPSRWRVPPPRRVP